MNTIDQAYIGLDLHANSSVFQVIDREGHQHQRERLLTKPAAMNDWLQALPSSANEAQGQISQQITPHDLN